MEVPHQSITQMKEKRNETSDGRSNPAHSTSGIKRVRKLGIAPQVVAVKQSDVQTKASSRFSMTANREMGEAAKNLPPEKMAALEIDIFKPLDFYEILFNRLKGSDEGRIISNINEL